MNFLRLLPVFISFLLLAAHFLRAGQVFVVIVLIALLLLLFLRTFWVPWVMQVVLLLGAAEWLFTLYSVAQVRIASGMPWVRMAIILGVVALFTALSSLVFRSKALRDRFQTSKHANPD
jgi:prepilin signal peptidase PulO-like enzyme (type II secretory pathway)